MPQALLALTKFTHLILQSTFQALSDLFFVVVVLLRFCCIGLQCSRIWGRFLLSLWNWWENQKYYNFNIPASQTWGHALSTVGRSFLLPLFYSQLDLHTSPPGHVLNKQTHTNQLLHAFTLGMCNSDRVLSTRPRQQWSIMKTMIVGKKKFWLVIAALWVAHWALIF